MSNQFVLQRGEAQHDLVFETEGVTLKFINCSIPQYMARARAHIKDERRGTLDSVPFTTELANDLICGWSGVHDEKTGEQLDFKKEYVQFLPYDMRAKVVAEATKHITERISNLLTPEQISAIEAGMNDPLVGLSASQNT